MTIQRFEDLKVWQKSQDLAVLVSKKSLNLKRQIFIRKRVELIEESNEISRIFYVLI